MLESANPHEDIEFFNKIITSKNFKDLESTACRSESDRYSIISGPRVNGEDIPVENQTFEYEQVS